MNIFRPLVIGLLSALLFIEITHIQYHLQAPLAGPHRAPTVIALTGSPTNAPVGVRPALAPARLAPESAADPYTVVDIARATVDHYTQSVALAAQARLVPAVREGVSIGVKLYRIAPRSLLQLIGLRNGDILKSINAHPVLGADYPAGLEFLRRPDRFLDLSIERDHTPTRIVVLIHD